MNKLTFDKNRGFSWSAISSFEYDNEQWYRKYVLGIEDPKGKEMAFGSMVGERLASDPDYLPNVPRLSHFEFEQPDGLKAKFGDIPLIGFIDSYEPHTKLFEYKTGKKQWTQKRADEHGQIDMYLLLLYLKHQVKPSNVECTIFWLPTQDNGDFSISFIDEKRVHAFKTTRSMRDVLAFGMRINKVYKEMIAYCENHV